MRLSDLKSKYEARRQEAEELGTMAPLCRVYESVLADLRDIDGVPDDPQYPYHRRGGRASADPASDGLAVGRRRSFPWSV